MVDNLLTVSAKIISRRSSEAPQVAISGNHSAHRRTAILHQRRPNVGRNRKLGDKRVARHQLERRHRAVIVMLLAAEAVEVHTAVVAAIVARAVVPVAIVGRVVVMTHTVAAAHYQAHSAVGIMVMMLKHSATQQRQSERQGHRHRLQSCFHIAKLVIIFEITPHFIHYHKPQAAKSYKSYIANGLSFAQKSYFDRLFLMSRPKIVTLSLRTNDKKDLLKKA